MLESALVIEVMDWMREGFVVRLRDVNIFMMDGSKAFVNRPLCDRVGWAWCSEGWFVGSAVK